MDYSQILKTCSPDADYSNREQLLTYYNDYSDLDLMSSTTDQDYNNRLHKNLSLIAYIQAYGYPLDQPTIDTINTNLAPKEIKIVSCEDLSTMPEYRAPVYRISNLTNETIILTQLCAITGFVYTYYVNTRFHVEDDIEYGNRGRGLYNIPAIPDFITKIGAATFVMTAGGYNCIPALLYSGTSPNDKQFNQILINCPDIALAETQNGADGITIVNHFKISNLQLKYPTKVIQSDASDLPLYPLKLPNYYNEISVTSSVIDDTCYEQLLTPYSLALNILEAVPVNNINIILGMSYIGDELEIDDRDLTSKKFLSGPMLLFSDTGCIYITSDNKIKLYGIFTNLELYYLKLTSLGNLPITLSNTDSYINDLGTFVVPNLIKDSSSSNTVDCQAILGVSINGIIPIPDDNDDIFKDYSHMNQYLDNLPYEEIYSITQSSLGGSMAVRNIIVYFKVTDVLKQTITQDFSMNINTNRWYFSTSLNGDVDQATVYYSFSILPVDVKYALDSNNNYILYNAITLGGYNAFTLDTSQTVPLQTDNPTTIALTEITAGELAIGAPNPFWVNSFGYAGLNQTPSTSTITSTSIIASTETSIYIGDSLIIPNLYG